MSEANPSPPAPSPASTPPLGPRGFAAFVRKGGTQRNAEPYWISRYLFRPWTAYLSWLLVKVGFSANGVTLLSAAAYLLGVVCLARDDEHVWFWLGGAGLILLYYALDHCDGEVARYDHLTGRRPMRPDGYYWDSIVHAIEPLLIVGLGFRLFHESGMGHIPLYVAALDITAISVAPWQRYCEAVMVWAAGRQRARSGEDVSVSVIANTSSTVLSDDGQGEGGGMSWKTVAAQTLLFPGYFLTLAIAVVLDVTIGPVHLLTYDRGGQAINAVMYWQMLWLIVHALGKVAAAVNSSIRNAGRLRRLES